MVVVVVLSRLLVHVAKWCLVVITVLFVVRCHGDAEIATVVGEDDVLSEIRADDALLDALGGRDSTLANALAEDELNALLLSWRREVESPPVGVPVATDAIAQAVTR
ncbi:anti-sigma-D factor RsdA [Saccharothrix sp. HUAS TT10]|uniref:anti-sigma-D factor RsdA n=1 Tax=Saccharothrix sp. HUAS TT10 TaxID=3447450 RepID=UPI003F6FF9C3